MWGSTIIGAGRFGGNFQFRLIKAASYGIHLLYRIYTEVFDRLLDLVTFPAD